MRSDDLVGPTSVETGRRMVAHFHDGHVHYHAEGEPHEHDGEEMSAEDEAALGDLLWSLENVELTTVGVDVGSSTSHLMFARVQMQRIGEGLSTRFVVVGREVLGRSPILLTPYRSDGTIDGDALGQFVHESYWAAGLQRADIDSGAVILTGEALKRRNAREIAGLFAEESGKFVCASAGHHLESVMAAHGSGATALSALRQQTILNVDIGGGTTKLALIHNGELLHTAAVAIGGRLVARGPDGNLVRIEGPARQVAATIGVQLTEGEQLSPPDTSALVKAWCDMLVDLIERRPASALVEQLMLTEALPATPVPEAITFSGGVAEYIYGREAGDYGDLGPALAAEICWAMASERVSLPLLDPGQGIRATVIGASQFTVQVSGNTIAVSDPTSLPLRNLPVLYPHVDLAAPVTADEIAEEVLRAVRRFDPDGAAAGSPVALAFRWHGDPEYARLRAIAEGVRDGLARSPAAQATVVLLFDRDVARLVGDILSADLAVERDLVCLDGMQLREFDYVDIGEIIMPTNVAPVVIKSLLFDQPVTAEGAPRG